MKKLSRWMLALVLVVVSGCAVFASHNLDDIFGPANSQNRQLVATEYSAPVSDNFYQEQVRPILESRCINCHACYDAPCQIKLTAVGGIERGGSKDRVYQGDRLLALEPTRLYEDARTTQAWREKGFYPILNEREQSPAANLQGSVLYRAIALRRQQGEFDSDVLPADQYDFSLNRDQQCPAIEEYNTFETTHPTWGMPYGLPQLTDHEYAVLTKWLVKGARMQATSNVPDSVQSQVSQWEQRLNGDSLKAQLVNRYIYEHIYLYSLYFDDEARYTYKLVRSSTPPGEPIERISTRRPYDHPGVDRVYYRLWLDPESRVQKTFIPMQLDDARYARWHDWFYQADYSVTQAGSYQPAVASNPFESFAQIPGNSRYRFLLDHAQNTIMAFIKGPVCRGQVAVNVINEQFWVFFVNPDLELHNIGSAFLEQNASSLALPASQSSNALPITSWVLYSEKQKNYLAAKAGLLEVMGENGMHFNTEMIWDGEGENSNAALTVMRHFDNASVEKGLVGPEPKTAWVIDYPLLERIHYLLVAGFDVFGNVGHQLVTRLYMDFLRMEGEMNFLMFLPREERAAVREYWYRQTNQTIKNYIFSDLLQVDVPSKVAYQTADHKREFLTIIEQRLAPVLSQQHELSQSLLQPSTQAALLSLQELQGRPVVPFPELAMMLIEREGQADAELVTIVHNRGHYNITSLLDEESTVAPQEDRLMVVRGIVGDYPNVLLRMTEQQVPAFVAAVTAIQSESDYTALLDQYGVRRTSDQFWATSDEIARLNKAMKPLSSGILDYNRLENR
ncbi:Fatty acid cis/trans isomerase (CTI) [Marinomonas aquimarina]|uniref:Fatty acid cis/trans isomerase (CTI) n=1 Tax=Marinomonas aquimarina TaxID=295068 RepID=A0A1A8TDE4_9GAMM|nr:fatty acid cis/trans isomerase [Marinomonas aquimarina]SBS30352.1 Fatty acid cis/trans isomerase (CTI) [Marinomonas aquimarina]